MHALIGVTVQLPEERDSCQIRAHVICCTVDLPARAMVQNVVQFNGFYGCSLCEQPGKTLTTSGGRGHVHVYPFEVDNPDGPSRDHDTLMKNACDALEKNEPVSLSHACPHSRVPPPNTCVVGGTWEYTHLSC